MRGARAGGRRGRQQKGVKGQSFCTARSLPAQGPFLSCHGCYLTHHMVLTTDLPAHTRTILTQLSQPPHCLQFCSKLLLAAKTAGWSMAAKRSASTIA